MLTLRSISILIVYTIIYLTSSIELSAEERKQLILNIGGSYFKSLYMAEVAMIQKEIELTDELEKAMITIEENGYTDTTNQEIKSLSKGAIIATDLLLKYLRTSIPLDGDLSKLVGDLSLKYNKSFDNINSCGILEDMYYLKYDAGITKATLAAFTNPYKAKCAEFDAELIKILSLYTHAWIKKTPASQELSDISDRYDKLLNNMLRYIAYVYSVGLDKATATQMEKLAIERQAVIKKIMTKNTTKLTKAEENLKRYMLE